MGEHDEERPISPARLSKTPSWITLGFVLGALFVLALPSRNSSVGPAPQVEPEPPPVRLERPALTEIEAVFADWGEAAIWQNDVTEVALWDTARRSYSLFYEVVRHNGVYYFRSIPQLTRPILTEGVPINAPLQYTTPVGVRSQRRRVEPGALRPPAEAPPKVATPSGADLSGATTEKNE
jgi:hypothetical protein